MILENLALTASLGFVSSKSCVISHLEQGKELWAPDWTDVPHSATGEAKKEPRPGCRHCAEGVSVGEAFRFETRKAWLKAYSCDTCDPVLRNILYLAEHEGTEAIYT